MQSVNDKAKAKQAQLLMQLLIQGVKQLQFVLVPAMLRCLLLFIFLPTFTCICGYYSVWRKDL